VGGSVKSAYAGGNIVCTKITLAPTPAPTPAPTYSCTCENGIAQTGWYCTGWATGPGPNICGSCDDNYGLASVAEPVHNSKRTNQETTTSCMRLFTLREYGSCASISEADCRNVAAIKGVNFLIENRVGDFPGCFVLAAEAKEFGAPWNAATVIHWNAATQGPFASCGVNGFACVCQRQ
jgi:hypothetical protein